MVGVVCCPRDEEGYMEVARKDGAFGWLPE